MSIQYSDKIWAILPHPENIRDSPMDRPRTFAEDGFGRLALSHSSSVISEL